MTRKKLAHGVRWREDTGFELRCEDCATRKRQCFWPLAEEFWNLRSLIRCKSCERDRKAKRIAERRRADPEWYLKTLADVREQKRYKNSLYNRRYRERRKAREEAA